MAQELLVLIIEMFSGLKIFHNLFILLLRFCWFLRFSLAVALIVGRAVLSSSGVSCGVAFSICGVSISNCA